jgi:hypothetical protein
MKIRCISPAPSKEDAKKLGIGKHYFPGRQQFGVNIGDEYLVFGVNVLDGEPWVYLLLLPAGYLHPVPLCMFEIVDKRISKYWLIDIGPKGNLKMCPESILSQPYYLDDLSNNIPEVVDDFQKIRDQLESEF